MLEIGQTAAATAVSREWVAQALGALEVDQLALIVFDSALPQAPAFDTGAGSPYSESAFEFFRFIRRLGFNGVQFGPQGAISRTNASPYDGTSFSRNPLSLALDRLSASSSSVQAGLLEVDQIASVLKHHGPHIELRVPHSSAFDKSTRLLSHLGKSVAQRWAEGFGAFVDAQRFWLEADALHSALCAHYGRGDHSEWPADADLWRHVAGPRRRSGNSLEERLGQPLLPNAGARLNTLRRQFGEQIIDYAAVQYLLQVQHESLQALGRELSLRWYGDMHVGTSRPDQWHFAALFLERYRMGAPPSRTNPEGQAWGYPLLDPSLYFAEDGSLGPALTLLDARVRTLFERYDAVRIDHPHGLVCPWVYREGTDDDLRAVREGARLFSSPCLTEHPDLARFSRVREQDLDLDKTPMDEGWVRRLTPAQVQGFAEAFEVLVRYARRAGGTQRLVCEVLSTLPHELERVLALYDLGRFRVTQKSKLDNPSDVYRSEHARPEDWLLLGNHDTPTIWQVVFRWFETGECRDRADYLATRLSDSPSRREELAARFRRGPSELAHAALADLFASRARSVMVSFMDLFGHTEPYNRPGHVSPDNWALRIPRDYAEKYPSAVAAGQALSIPRALSLALAARVPNSPLLDT